MHNTVDARGQNCPIPVIWTKKMLKEANHEQITTIVDNETAKDNVIALAREQNCQVEVEQCDGDFYIKLIPGAVTEDLLEMREGMVILVGSDQLGRGSEELGRVLMKSFLFALQETNPLPSVILFINSGVLLTIEGSPVLESLYNLCGLGVEIGSCGTCLDYYQVKEKLAVGQVTNMYTILEKVNNAAKVLTV